MRCRAVRLVVRLVGVRRAVVVLLSVLAVLVGAQEPEEVGRHRFECASGVDMAAVGNAVEVDYIRFVFDESVTARASGWVSRSPDWTGGGALSRLFVATSTLPYAEVGVESNDVWVMGGCRHSRTGRPFGLGCAQVNPGLESHSWRCRSGEFRVQGTGAAHQYRTVLIEAVSSPRGWSRAARLGSVQVPGRGFRGAYVYTAMELGGVAFGAGSSSFECVTGSSISHTVPEATGGAATSTVQYALPAGSPSWVSLSGRVLSGTCPAAGSGSFTVRASRGSESADHTVLWEAFGSLAASSSSFECVAGAVVAHTVPVVGGATSTYALASGSPSWVSLSGRAVSGSCPAVGSGSFVVRVTRGAEGADHTVRWQSYSVLAGGSASYSCFNGESVSWALSGVSGGKSPYSATVPAAGGSSWLRGGSAFVGVCPLSGVSSGSFTSTVSDGLSQMVSLGVSWRRSVRPLVDLWTALGVTLSCTTGLSLAAYTVPAASGGTGPYVYSRRSGDAWLSFNTGTRRVSANCPSSPVTGQMVVDVRDSVGVTDAFLVTVVVGSPVTVPDPIPNNPPAAGSYTVSCSGTPEYRRISETTSEGGRGAGYAGTVPSWSCTFPSGTTLTRDQVADALADVIGRESDIPASDRRDIRNWLDRINRFVCGSSWGAAGVAGGVEGVGGGGVGGAAVSGQLFGIGETLQLGAILVQMAKDLAVQLRHLYEMLQQICGLRNILNVGRETVGELRDIEEVLAGSGRRFDYTFEAGRELGGDVVSIGDQLETAVERRGHSGSVQAGIDQVGRDVLSAAEANARLLERTFGDDYPDGWDGESDIDTAAEAAELGWDQVRENEAEGWFEEVGTLALQDRDGEGGDDRLVGDVVQYDEITSDSLLEGTAVSCIAARPLPTGEANEGLVGAFRRMHARTYNDLRETDLAAYLCALRIPTDSMGGRDYDAVCVGAASAMSVGGVSFHPRFCLYGSDAPTWANGVVLVIRAILLVLCSIVAVRVWVRF